MPESAANNRTVGRAAWLHRGATIALVLVACARATISHERIPLWDFDPWQRFIPATGIGPSAIAWTDALITALAALAVAGVALRGQRIRAAWAALALAGTAAILAHATRAGDLWLEPLAVGAAGSSWIAGIALLVALAHASRDRWLHRLALAIAIAAIAVLALKGLVQVFYEHPQTVRQYRLDREAILASRGWEPNSAQARGFERRLFQAEATGWFGLSNVYATFAASMLVACGATALAWLRTSRTALTNRAWQVTIAGALLAGVALWLSASKGGAGAALVASAALVATIIAARRAPKLAPLIGPATIALVLAAIAARGLIGTRLGELSLLFRAFYTETALRIWGAHPVLGVGPDNFQDAYLLAKPAISPEAVTSPHSVLFDWTSMLGLGGLAWAGLLLAVASATTAGLRPLPRPDRLIRSPRTAIGVKPLFLLTVPVILAGALAERHLASPELAVMRLVALGAWVALAIALLRAFATRPALARLGAAGAGLVLLVHSQIEMPLTQAPSVPLGFALVGLGVPPLTRGRAQRPVGLVAALLLALAIIPLALAATGLARWESRLIEAGDPLRPMGTSIDRPDRQTLADALDSAEEPLASAFALRPGHEPTGKALTRLRGAIAAKTGDPDALERAVTAARALALARPDSSSVQGWLGLTTTSGAQSGLVAPATAERWLEDGLEALQRAAALDPHGVTPAARTMEAFAAAGRPAEAATWARETLRRDDLTGLDPLVGLGERERRRVQRLATGG